jgi:hypothetical protein
MRPIRDYPSLTVSDLEDELCQVATVLERAMQALAQARTVHNCDLLKFYYESAEESHAARQRAADYNTQTQLADVIEFEQQVAAYRLNYETLVSFISWRRSDVYDGISASRL